MAGNLDGAFLIGGLIAENLACNVLLVGFFLFFWFPLNLLGH